MVLKGTGCISWFLHVNLPGLIHSPIAFEFGNDVNTLLELIYWENGRLILPLQEVSDFFLSTLSVHELD